MFSPEPEAEPRHISPASSGAANPPRLTGLTCSKHANKATGKRGQYHFSDAGHGKAAFFQAQKSSSPLIATHVTAKR